MSTVSLIPTALVHPGSRSGRLLLSLGAALVMLLLALAGGFAAADRAWFDWLSRHAAQGDARPPPLDPVIVAIDEAYIDARNEPLALMHEDLGAFFDALRLGGARAAGLDVVLPQWSAHQLTRRGQPDFRYDVALLRPLRAAAQTADLYLGETWDVAAQRFRPILIDTLVMARGRRAETPRTSVLVCPDADNVVRRLAGASCQPAAGVTPLSYALAGLPSTTADGRWIDFALGQPFVPLSFAAVIAQARAGEVEALRAQFADRVVLLGSIMQYEDRIAVPLPLFASEPESRVVPGVLVHAQMLRTLAAGSGIAVQPQPLVWLLATLLGIGVLLPRQRLYSLGLGGAGLLLLGGLAERLFRTGQLLPVAAVVFTVILALALRAGLDYVHAERERRTLRRSFSGCVSPQVLQAILSGRVQPDKRGEQREAAVLFADIRGFTTLSSQLPPATVFHLLNDYLACMTEAIHAHGGTIDKFIGDGIMAVFGYPESRASQYVDAIAAGQAMQAAMVAFNLRHSQTPLQIGVGVHSGMVMAGAVGSAQRFEFTVIGDTVNTASRLEGLTKELGVALVASRIAWEQAGAPAGFVSFGSHAVRGRQALELMGWSLPAPAAVPVAAAAPASH